MAAAFTEDANLSIKALCSAIRSNVSLLGVSESFLALPVEGKCNVGLGEIDDVDEGLA